MNDKTDLNNRRQLNKDSNKLGTIFIVSGLFVLIVIASVIYWYNHTQNIKHLDEDQFGEMSEMIRSIQTMMKYSYNNLEVISVMDLTKQVLNNPSESNKKWLQDTILKTSETVGIYQQMRVLDTTGQEIVRIDKTSEEHAFLIEDDLLQDKSDRYYVKDTLNLTPGSLYMSPFDLNTENGVIEVPYNPVIRLGKKVFDSNNDLIGLSICNLLGQEILDEIDEKKIHYEDTIYMLNSEGYYIYNDDIDKTFGFMFEDKKEVGFFSDFETIWNGLLEGETLFKRDDERFYSMKFSLLENVGESNINNTFYMIMRVPEESVMAINTDLRMSLLIALILLAVFISVLGWELGKQITHNRQYKSKLIDIAMKDELTGLYNRRMVYDRLIEEIALARRHHLSLVVVFLDVNSLKEVNDNYGHIMGDKMIISAGESLVNSVREYDVVSRLGGDEFLVVLIDCTEDDVVNIMKRASEKFKIHGLNAIEKEWSMSYGISVLENGDTPDILVSRADKKMYENKSNFKKHHK
ncbi:MAG: GGDEF domain-containing protein [Clostridiales bacterium]|nr:GGDEF domain-containing protein [Clostridiales bacterium]